MVGVQKNLTICREAEVSEMNFFWIKSTFTAMHGHIYTISCVVTMTEAAQKYEEKTVQLMMMRVFVLLHVQYIIL